MFETNNDSDDLGEFEPHVTAYLNEGYRLLAQAAGIPQPQPLTGEGDAPALPEWMHRGLADYGAWMVYRNGPGPKQNRGLAFRQSFDALTARARLWAARQGGAAGQFYNIY